MVKNGSRLQSQVDATQVIVVKTADCLDNLRCGGVPMGAFGTQPTGTPDPAFSDGTLMGKRYVDDDGEAEVLVTKPGTGTLTIGDTPLTLKDAKPLPASD